MAGWRTRGHVSGWGQLQTDVYQIWEIRDSWDHQWVCLLLINGRNKTVFSLTSQMMGFPVCCEGNSRQCWILYKPVSCQEINGKLGCFWGIKWFHLIFLDSGEQHCLFAAEMIWAILIKLHGNIKRPDRQMLCFKRSIRKTDVNTWTHLISSVSGTLVYGSMALTLLLSSTGCGNTHRKNNNLILSIVDLPKHTSVLNPPIIPQNQVFYYSPLWEISHSSKAGN